MFERLIYVALWSDTFALAAMLHLSNAERAETKIFVEGEPITFGGPVVPIFTYHPNGMLRRFPSKAIRIIRTDKLDPRGRDIPLPAFTRSLVIDSQLAIALKKNDPPAPQNNVVLGTALKTFHREQTGENLSPGVKTHRPVRITDSCGVNSRRTKSASFCSTPA